MCVAKALDSHCGDHVWSLNVFPQTLAAGYCNSYHTDTCTRKAPSGIWHIVVSFICAFCNINIFISKIIRMMFSVRQYDGSAHNSTMVTKTMTCLGVWQVLLLVQHWHILWVGSSWLCWIGSMCSIWLGFSHWRGMHFGATWYMTLQHSTRGSQMLNRSIWNVLLETLLLPARCVRNIKSESNKSLTN